MTAHQSRKGWWQGRAIIRRNTIDGGSESERPTFFVEEVSPYRVVAVLRERVDHWHLSSDL